MKFIKSVIRHWSTICRAILSIFLAMATSYVFRNYFTVLLLAEKNFSGRNSLIKISLFSVYTIVLTVIYFFYPCASKKPAPILQTIQRENSPFSKVVSYFIHTRHRSGIDLFFEQCLLNDPFTQSNL